MFCVGWGLCISDAYVFRYGNMCLFYFQDSISSANLVRLFEPVTSPHCYAIIASKLAIVWRHNYINRSRDCEVLLYYEKHAPIVMIIHLVHTFDKLEIHRILVVLPCMKKDYKLARWINKEVHIYLFIN